MKLSDFINKGNERRYIFFAGKGGVGKSTMSCAAALWAAKTGKKTLLVTTDTASNLSDIFEMSIGNKLTQVLPNLTAIEIDPKESAKKYREHAEKYFRTQFSGAKLNAILEELKSPCVEEVAALNEFISYFGKEEFEIIIFDTAPSGHTLRLLELPGSWSMELSKEGYTCIGPNDTLQEDRINYEKAVAVLQNTSKTMFVFVTSPEKISVEETKRAMHELEKISIKTGSIIINGVIPDSVRSGALSDNKKKQEESMMNLRENFPGEVIEYPLLPRDANGLDQVSTIAENIFQEKSIEFEEEEFTPLKTEDHPPDEIIKNFLEPTKSTRYLFIMGKGGVGKSTIASIMAYHQSKNSHKTLLVTTDPADHLTKIFDTDAEVKVVNENLHLANIDTKRAHEEYKKNKLQEMMDKMHANINVELTKKKIEEELNSPCAEEVAYFEKFMSYFDIEDYDFIIFDTAPTGHTLRMLELPSEWNDFAGADDKTENRYKKIIETMRDKEQTSFAFVTLPEYTPMMEASRASKELNRFVGINTSFVVINKVLSEKAENWFINERIEQQNEYIHKIKELFGVPIVTMPYMGYEPIGLSGLDESSKKLFREV